MHYLEKVEMRSELDALERYIDRVTDVAKVIADAGDTELLRWTLGEWLLPLMMAYTQRVLDETDGA